MSKEEAKIFISVLGPKCVLEGDEFVQRDVVTCFILNKRKGE